jgi:predicted glycoside hydrolase/deacetylase ChbG (UPF0249 family)
MNANNWGQDEETTSRTLDCIMRGSVSSVSAMVYMKDSERAAVIARESGIDAGLHLNFTTPFSGLNCSTALLENQQKLASYLLRNRFARAIFHPSLVRPFEYVVNAQIDEFCRLYGAQPDRFDGHHHMHLCANVLIGGLLPAGTVVRRHFSYEVSEKSVRNRIFRKITDGMLRRRHRVTDFFFSLKPFDRPGRLERIFSVARKSVVEMETHPVLETEYRFLTEGDTLRRTADLPIAKGFTFA